MALPLWDDIELPPDHTLVDINGLEPESLRLEMQGRALELWIAEVDADVEDFVERDWNDDEGIFAIYDADDVIVGIQIITDVEDA